MRYLTLILNGAAISMLLYAMSENANYMMVKIVATILFLSLALIDKRPVRWAYIILSAVFNPFIRPKLKYDEWCMVDSSVAIVLSIILAYDAYLMYKSGTRNG